MTLPYQEAEAGSRAGEQIKKDLRRLGASSVGIMEDFESGDLRVQFVYRGHHVDLRASATGYAAAWKRHNPRGPQTTRDTWEQRAEDKGRKAVYSMLRDWIKGQVTAVETGLLSFETAFAPHFLLGDGRRVIDYLTDERVHPALAAPKGDD